MRNALIAAVVVTALASACTEGTSPQGQDPEALLATFTRTADSLVQNGDSASGSTYGMAADLIRAGVRPTSVTVAENGVPTPWTVIAQRFTVPTTPCTYPSTTGILPGTSVTLPPPACAMQFAPVVLAWRTAEPTRMLTIVAPDGQSTAGPRALTNSMMFLPGTSAFAAATLSDRVTRQVFFASSGSVSVTRPATTANCTEAPRLPGDATATCQVGDFTIAFDLTLNFPSDSLGGGPVAPQRLVMSSRTINGVIVAVTNAGTGPVFTIPIPRPPSDSGPGNPPPTIPNVPSPINFDTLPASLSAVVASSGVTFTLEVRNLRSQAQAVRFNSGQRMDLRVHDSAGSVIYVWSADKSFTAAIGVDTIPAGGTRSYTATWNSPRSGTFRALGLLTSASHAAAASVNVTIP